MTALRLAYHDLIFNLSCELAGIESVNTGYFTWKLKNSKRDLRNKTTRASLEQNGNWKRLPVVTKAVIEDRLTQNITYDGTKTAPVDLTNSSMEKCEKAMCEGNS